MNRPLTITTQITRRDEESLEMYFKGLKVDDRVTAEEEVLLTHKIKAGDREAVEKLIKANLRFVVSVAKQYKGTLLSLNDLIQAGNIGLIEAIKTFDETFGFKLISHAVWYIRRSIIQELSSSDRIIRLPQNQYGSLNKINKAVSKLEQDFECDISLQKGVEVIDGGEKHMDAVPFHTKYHPSLDAPVSPEDGAVSLIDVYTTHHNEDEGFGNIARQDLRKEIRVGLNAVTSERHKKILCMYYGIPEKETDPYPEFTMQMDDIAHHFGISIHQSNVLLSQAEKMIASHIKRFRKNENRGSSALNRHNNGKHDYEDYLVPLW